MEEKTGFSGFESIESTEEQESRDSWLEESSFTGSATSRWIVGVNLFAVMIALIAFVNLFLRSNESGLIFGHFWLRNRSKYLTE